ncbi:hypothetical protein L2E82_47943 [Cichorium intybus]|uniref:Uncharacterized protein n=1 Tax=Cichorium intybus TaxID=13427 RepID=A0ACB8YXM9_CICIN|nr:hypothetical protein L2E82_47943 [Cichorium intybus]
MTTTMITDLNPGDGDKQIEIKVIRKWVSYGRKSECCYIFLDKNGDAIEACSWLGEKALHWKDRRYLSPDQNPAKPLLKIKIENLREKMIEATFWDEAAKSFDKEAVQALPDPVIVAITSMKVTKYQGNMQLTATPASYIYINPDIPETASMTSGFILRDSQNPILKIQYQKDKDVGVVKERNKFTLIDLLSQKPGRYGGAHFTCKASLVHIDESRGWF